ncbi:unnamed protein product [Protopolystoma xenopodis]|uniref:Uncharacterized protein n=1 Tax=Protopolystoma xenopodis TaxID=117903 RepID=A0A3S5BIE0_9PLAT|nr:unnamed protein product [Protopolystoma xenopodis]
MQIYLIELMLLRLVDLECPMPTLHGKHGGSQGSYYHSGGGGASPGRPPVLACRPSRLLRRFFEALASGLLLSCYAHMTASTSIPSIPNQEDAVSVEAEKCESNPEASGQAGASIGTSCFRSGSTGPAAGPISSASDDSQNYHYGLLSRLLATAPLTPQQREDLTFVAHRDLRRLAFRQHCQVCFYP